MTDDRFEDELERAAQDYHRPPETPREEIWARITAERARRREARQAILFRPWVRWSLAAAAVLTLGVGIGRLTVPHGTADTGAAIGGRTGSDFAYRVAATQYLTRTEALLTDFRAEARTPQGGRPDAQFAAQARDLLVTTRLMLSSPAAKDQRLKSLLEDLEVMLAQIAQLAADRNGHDVEFINQGLDQRSVLLRLRAASPAPGTSARGAL
ncbi:MAG TPA: hypothetical protein VNG95_03845 [Gemmatimonadales bacterium]|nr:hypothetical protein [Gemmatimonadales bacterium]